MGLFDFFKKKKQDNQLNELLGVLIGQAFPAGKAQITDIAQKLHKEFNGKYPIERLRKSIVYCGTMFIQAKEKSLDRIVSRGMMVKPDNIYTQKDAERIYDSYLRSYYQSKYGEKGDKSYEEFYISLGNKVVPEVSKTSKVEGSNVSSLDTMPLELLAKAFKNQVPSKINPSSIEVSLKMAKRADLDKEFRTTFTVYEYNVEKTNFYTSQLRDIVRLYLDYELQENILGSDEKDNDYFVLSHLRRYFAIGILTCTQALKYKENIGRWTDIQFNQYLEWLKDSINIEEEIRNVINDSEDWIDLDDVLSALSEDIIRKYKEEYRKEINTICRTIYYIGFDYAFINILKLNSSPIQNQGISINLSKSITYAYREGRLMKEEFIYDDKIMKSGRIVSDRVYHTFSSGLLADSSGHEYMEAYRFGIGASFHAGMLAVLNNDKINLEEYFNTDLIDKIKSVNSKGEEYSYLRQYDTSGIMVYLCNCTPLELKDSEKDKVLHALFYDEFLLGMTFMLQIQRYGVFKAMFETKPDLKKSNSEDELFGKSSEATFHEDAKSRNGSNSVSSCTPTKIQTTHKSEENTNHNVMPPMMTPEKYWGRGDAINSCGKVLGTYRIMESIFFINGFGRQTYSVYSEDTGECIVKGVRYRGGKTINGFDCIFSYEDKNGQTLYIKKHED